MKKIYTFILMFSLLVNFQGKAQYAHQNISFLGNFYNPAQVAEPGYGIKYNSVWGWVDTVHSNTEYAILGSGSGTYFLDLSDPTNPIQRDYVPGKRSLCIWREYKTFGKYLYAVSDDSSPNSLQIIDMSYLPDSVHVVYDGTSLFERAHTLYVDGNKLYCGSVTLAGGAGYYSMAVYSLANPVLPTLLRTLNLDDPGVTTVHDMLVRNDTVYASCGNQGMFLYKFNSSTNMFSAINSLTTYPEQGYNHSSTISPDGHLLIFCDEVPAGKGIKILNTTDLTNLSVSSVFRSNIGATPHNPYIKGKTRVVVAYYQDGVQIFDISNPAAPVRTGYFDTDTTHGLNDGYPTSSTYHGAWGAYIDLPSGVVLVSDMQNGLYVLDASAALGIKETPQNSAGIAIYPNPVADNLTVSLDLKDKTDLAVAIFDVTGRKILSHSEDISPGKSSLLIETANFTPGIYLIRITGKNVHYSQQFVKE